MATPRQSEADVASTVVMYSRSGMDVEMHQDPYTPPCHSPLSALDQMLVTATENFSCHGTLQAGATQKGKDIQHVPMDREKAFLLRHYEEGLGTWMDVFDCTSSYRDVLLTLVPSSPLLLHSICALAARQLSLVSCAQTWTPVAERYYGRSLSLLRSLLTDLEIHREQAIVASILLSSYELLKSPNHPNYHQHFSGAKSLVEVLRAYDSTKRLTRASFWIYVRHEVGEAMNLESRPMLNPKLWPKADFSDEGGRFPDAYCNDVLRITSEVIHLIFGSSNGSQRRRWAKEWSGLNSDLDDWLRDASHIMVGEEYEEHESRRFWFPRPAFAAAICFYHVSKMFLVLHGPEPPSRTIEQTEDLPEQAQHHANYIIDIALSEQPDSVLVTMVQPVAHAARHTRDSVRRREAILRLENIRAKTGFHTESIVQRLKSPSEV